MRLEMMRVVAVAEVRHHRDRKLGARGGKAPEDRAVRIDAAPRALMARLQLLRRHLLGLEHHVLAVVKLPVLAEDTAGLVEPAMQRRAREWGEDREARQIDRGIDRKLHGLIEHVVRVVVVAEDEAALHADPECMQIADPVSYTHLDVYKRQVLAVVKLPVLAEDTAGLVEPAMQRRAREWGEDREARQIDRGIDRKLHGLIEHVVRVVVVAEDEAALHADPECMQIADQRVIERRIIEALAHVAQARIADALEADQEPAATAPRHQLHQLGVAPDQAGREAEPAHLERNKRREQLGRISAVRDQVEVDEDDPPGANAPDIGDHMSDRFLELSAAPGSRHDAEFAIVRAGARGLEHRLGEEMAFVEQLPPGKRQVGEGEVVPLVVTPLHAPAGEVAQQLRPGLLCIADADRIGVLRRFLRHQRDVRAAEHHLDLARAVVPGQLIAARCASGDHGDADELGIEIARYVGDAFVVEREVDRELVRRERGKRGERQRLVTQRLLEDAAAVAIERSLRRYEGDLHPALAPTSAS